MGKYPTPKYGEAEFRGERLAARLSGGAAISDKWISGVEMRLLSCVVDANKHKLPILVFN